MRPRPQRTLLATVAAIALLSAGASAQTAATPPAVEAASAQSPVAPPQPPPVETANAALATAQPSVAPPSAPAIPAPSRARPASNTDEAGLWAMSDRAELDARASGQLEQAPELNAYIRGVACRVAADACGDIRLYVMNRPYFNASMAPNGYMEVWSGLLLRAEDEAQLAFVLGHEIGHFEQNHSLLSMRETRSRANAALILSIGIAAAGTAAAVNSPTSAGSISDISQAATDLVYLSTVAGLFSFSRELEAQADAIGFDHARAAGYDPNAGSALWNNLIAESQASDNPDVRRQEARASIFNSHPLSADRLAALHQLALAHPSSGETFRERYRAAIRPHLDPWLRAELRRRDFGETLSLLDRLARPNEDMGVIEFYRGEVYRLRRHDGDAAKAAEHYGAAVNFADAPAAAYRELGEARARAGDNAAAATLLTNYLQRAPQAPDRLLIEARLSALAPAPTPQAAATPPAPAAAVPSPPAPTPTPTPVTPSPTAPSTLAPISTQGTNP